VAASGHWYKLAMSGKYSSGTGRSMAPLRRCAFQRDGQRR
jgi:hypothetical protein